MVMLVSIKASHCILFLESFLFEHVKNLLLIRYLVVAHDETLIHAHWLVQLKPWISADVFDFETFFGICI